MSRTVDARPSIDSLWQSFWQSYDHMYPVRAYPEAAVEWSLMERIRQRAFKLDREREESDALVVASASSRCPICGVDTPHGHAQTRVGINESGC